MILAQSPRQRLNGSKMIYPVLILAAALNLYSCGSSRNVAAKAVPIYAAPPPPEKTKEVETPPTPAKSAPEAKIKKPNKEREYDSLNRFYPETTKDRYNVAVVLPFYLNYEGLTRAQKNSSAIAADYYRGGIGGRRYPEILGGRILIFM